MPTLTQARPQKSAFVIPADLEEVEYPPEIIRQLEREVEIAKAQLAAGELVPMTAAEYAAKRGLRIG